MKLSHRTLVAAVPLFVLLGIVGNGGAWFLKAWELRLAAERAATSVAVTLAEEAAAHDAVATAEGKAAMDRGAKNLARWNLIERITLFDDAGRDVWSWQAADASANVVVPLELRPGQLQRGERLVQVRSDHPVVRAVAATSGGRVEVAWRLPQLLEEIRRMRGRFIVEACLAVFVGFWLVWALGRMLTTDVRRLTVVMPQVGGGAYEAPQNLRVAELDDLSRTLGVLDALTHEARRKFDHTQAELELIRTDEDLGKAFRRSWLKPVEREVVGRQVTLRLLSDTAVGHAFGASERTAPVGGKGPMGVVWMARLEEKPGLDTAREASAVGAELAAALRDGTRDIATAVTQVATWFALKRMVVMAWSEAEGPVSIYRWKPVDGIRTRTFAGARAFCSDDTGVTVDAGATLVKSAGGETTAEVMAALANLLGGAGGVVALIEMAAEHDKRTRHDGKGL